MGILTGIAAGAQAIGGLMQRKSEKKAATTQYQRTKELQDRAHEQQKEMWNYTNYPNQVKMMKEAGLNPALMYGQGGGGGTTAGSGNMGSVSQEQVSNVGANAAQAAMMLAQIENVKADTKVKEKEAAIKGQAEESGAIDLEVKKRIGLDSWERRAGIEMQAANAEDTQKIREFDAWMSEAFDDAAGTLKVDAAGSYSSSENDLIRKAKRAGMTYFIQDLERLKKDIVLKGDQHDLNEIEKEIRSFAEDLTKVGLNQVSATIITKLLQLIFSKK